MAVYFLCILQMVGTVCLLQLMGIYFLLEPRTNLVKVGYSKNPMARIRALQTANPNKLALLAVVKGDKRDEAILHRRLTQLGKHVSGEWFIYDAQTREILQAYANGHLDRSFQNEKGFEDLQRLVKNVSDIWTGFFGFFSKKR